jgi:predicted transcriptional regulator
MSQEAPLEVTPVPPLPRLGELETAVLEHLWVAGAADVKAVHRAIGAPRGITHNTVQSAMERLFRKGLLAREKVSHAYVYSPRQTREELGARVVQDVVARLLQGEAASVLEAFVDLAARTDSTNLDRLENLIAQRRKGSR